MLQADPKEMVPKRQEQKLRLFGRIYMSDISELITKPTQGMLQIFWRTGEFRIESFLVKLKNEKTVSAWETIIQQQMTVHSRLPSAPSEFSWMREDFQLENPYAVSDSDEDSHDDDNVNSGHAPDRTWETRLAPAPPIIRPAQLRPLQLKVRVDQGGNYVHLVISSNSTYQSLIDRIDAKMSRFSNLSISRGQLKLRYSDEDGDFVNVSCDEDLQLVITEEMEKLRFDPLILWEVKFYCIDSQPTWTCYICLEG